MYNIYKKRKKRKKKKKERERKRKEEKEMKKGNPQKKMILQDNFIKQWCCSAKNHPEGWSWWKKYNRKKFRRQLKKELDKEEGV